VYTGQATVAKNISANALWLWEISNDYKIDSTPIFLDGFSRLPYGLRACDDTCPNRDIGPNGGSANFHANSYSHHRTYANASTTAIYPHPHT